MILPPVPWRSRAALVHLVEALGARDGLTRFIGGAVRDTLLHLPLSDLDLATALEPDEVIRRLAAEKIKAVPTGIAHGTITAVLASGPVEVTTLRRDVSTDGRHAVVAFTADWQADAARRDFTINALSADPISGEVFDYFGGLADLEARHVRFIGEPLERIAEDHLRILRFFRFHARFGSDGPDPAGLEACTARANDLMTLSRERIAQEMLKLLAVTDPVPTLSVMVEHSILKPVLPEIDRDGVARLARLVVRETPTGIGSALRRLSALLPPDPALAQTVAARLKLSNAQRKRLSLAAEAGEPGEARSLAHAIGLESARDRLLLRGSGEAWARGLEALSGWEPPRFPIGGGALVALGLKAGPSVAATLQAVERRWVEEGFPDEERVRAIALEEVGRTAQRRPT